MKQKVVQPRQPQGWQPVWIDNPRVDSTAMLSAYLRTIGPARRPRMKLRLETHRALLKGESVVWPPGVLPTPCTTTGCFRCEVGQGGYTFRWYHPSWAMLYTQLRRTQWAWTPGETPEAAAQNEAHFRQAQRPHQARMRAEMRATEEALAAESGNAEAALRRINQGRGPPTGAPPRGALHPGPREAGGRPGRGLTQTLDVLILAATDPHPPTGWFAQDQQRGDDAAAAPPTPAGASNRPATPTGRPPKARSAKACSGCGSQFVPDGPHQCPCRQACYCSKECQVKAWCTHKQACAYAVARRQARNPVACNPVHECTEL